MLKLGNSQNKTRQLPYAYLICLSKRQIFVCWFASLEMKILITTMIYDIKCEYLMTSKRPNLVPPKLLFGYTSEEVTSHQLNAGSHRDATDIDWRIASINWYTVAL